MLPRAEQIVADLETGKVVEPGRIERELLTPWRPACFSVVSEDVSEKARPVVAAITDYCQARTASWETLAKAARSHANRFQKALDGLRD